MQMDGKCLTLNAYYSAIRRIDFINLAIEAETTRKDKIVSKIVCSLK